MSPILLYLNTKNVPTPEGKARAEDYRLRQCPRKASTFSKDSNCDLSPIYWETSLIEECKGYIKIM